MAPSAAGFTAPEDTRGCPKFRPASAHQWAALAGRIGFVFDILRKLFALEKQSPLGAYLSAAELGRRVHAYGVRMCMCMACA